MDDWFSLFKQSPVGAILGSFAVAFWWLFKNRQERGEDNREVTRLSTALKTERDARVEAEDSRDAAISKQIELVERFSETRAQNERLLERMEALTKQIELITEENMKLRGQVRELVEQVHLLETTLRSGV